VYVYDERMCYGVRWIVIANSAVRTIAI